MRLYSDYIGIIFGLNPSDYTWDYKKDRRITAGLQKKSSDYMRLYSDYIGIIFGLHWDYIYQHGITFGLHWDYIYLRSFPKKRFGKQMFHFGQINVLLRKILTFPK